MSCLSFANLDSLAGCPGLTLDMTQHLAFVWLCKSDCEWKALMSPTLSSSPLVLWNCTLVGEVTVPACFMATLSSQLIFPYRTALLLLVPGNQHPSFSMVILLSFTISIDKHKCNVSSHAFSKGVLQSLLHSHFLYLSKTFSPSLYCTIYEINTIAPFRREQALHPYREWRLNHSTIWMVTHSTAL